MLINNLLWILIGAFVGVIGFKIEKHKKNGLFFNSLFGIFGGYLGGFAAHFIINPGQILELDLTAILFSFIVAFVFVKLEDYIFPG